ncbi:glycerate kinase [Bifidobacterium longum]|uniref:glycerate kinase n=1 Tax=Bifidobacterium longum TaxID=216816 RepID=UPI00214CBBE8|nr:glycerate kinase [Bifidobacterium longum]
MLPGRRRHWTPRWRTSRRSSKPARRRCERRAGAGAAGGIGAALKGFLDAEFRPGIAIVIEQSGLDAAAQWADVVFTGEGSIDFQTKFGKPRPAWPKPRSATASP